MAQPIISVALPVKNGLPGLRETIAGLRRQTYRNFVLVVQDSASSDGSLEYLKSLDTFFEIQLVSEPDPSLTAGYARALRRCTGDLVVASACDEALDPDALERYVSWHEEHPDAIFIYGGSRLVTAENEVVQEFQPKPFDLVDYIRHKMCPTTAGAFNRNVLGDELHFDETLKTCPDFELLTRVALRFGPERIICKNAITMTARADASSMSFRPQSFAQFASDKSVVVDRLLTGPLRDEFSAFLRRDIMHNLHALNAGIVYSIGGDIPEFREQVLSADAQLPRQTNVKSLVQKSRGLFWDQASQRVGVRKNVPPAVPPAGMAKEVFRAEPGMTRAMPHWVTAGAKVTPGPRRVDIVTPQGPWHYAAVTELDYSKVSMGGANWNWLRVTVNDVRGCPMLSLFNPSANEISSEVRACDNVGVRDYYFDLYDPAFAQLLIRNGGVNAVSSVRILGVTILTMPVVHEYAIS